MQVVSGTFFFIAVSTAMLGILAPNKSKANDDLAYHSPNYQYQLVDITFNDNMVAIPVIKHDSELALSKGVVLLVADVDAQGIQQQTLLTMAEDLPQWGWNTLFVVPKEAYFVSPPVIMSDAIDNNTATETESLTSDSNNSDTTDDNTEKQTEAEQASSQDDADNTAPVKRDEPAPIMAQQTELKPFELQHPQLNYSYDEYTAFTQVLLQQLAQQYMSKPGYKILVSQGKTASVSLNILQANSVDSNNTAPLFNALVLNNVHWPSSTHNRLVSAHLSKVSIPILDFAASNDNLWSQATQRARIVDSRVALKSLYRQRDVFGTHYSVSQSHYLSTEMRGFTAYLGW